MLVCGLRRHEVVAWTLDHLQQREEHWAIVDSEGKGGHVRTVPVPDWVKNRIDEWLVAAAIGHGRLFRKVSKWGKDLRIGKSTMLPGTYARTSTACSR